MKIRWIKASGDTIQGSIRIIFSNAFLNHLVTPVRVTGAHFSTMRNVCGTMDTGDERRYDLFVFCIRPNADANVGLTGQQWDKPDDDN
ncbi:MAG: hypothetical protein ACR2OV_14125 [Hyphomicrobiaceae bacterium]